MIDSNKVCYLCGDRATDTHHIFNGAMRNKSEQYGAVIKVCRECHDLIHKDYTLRESLKSEFQHRIMVDKNMNISQWIDTFHKNYLDYWRTDE